MGWILLQLFPLVMLSRWDQGQKQGPKKVSASCCLLAGPELEQPIAQIIIKHQQGHFICMNEVVEKTQAIKITIIATIVKITITISNL